jgi:hypothetical protein
MTKTKTKKKGRPPGIPGKPIGTKRARELASLRMTYAAGPGRPRSKKRRCPCGLMTLKLARIRCHHCEPAPAKEDL